MNVKIDKYGNVILDEDSKEKQQPQRRSSGGLWTVLIVAVICIAVVASTHSNNSSDPGNTDDGYMSPANQSSNGYEYSYYAQPTEEPELWGLTIDKLSTRSGPSPRYTDMGTYNVKGEWIKVLSRVWDSNNEIWWVKCEIPYRGDVLTLWTGYKRFDSSTIPLNSIPIENY